MLPRLITRIDPRYDTPANAVHAQAVLAIGYALALGFALGDPLKALALQGTISTTLIVVIYICTGASCVVFHLRDHRNEFNVILHLVIPLAAAVLFVPVLLAALGIDFGGLGIEPLTSPADVAPYVVAIWMALGLLVLVHFARSDPRRISGIRQVFGESAPESDG
ncbi:MAG TPA: hypothetical protein VMF07_10815 [Solirubrobacteraceae bacterium]|nr:hypothetical protein [Solirubrobacteraceae bacterium]